MNLLINLENQPNKNILVGTINQNKNKKIVNTPNQKKKNMKGYKKLTKTVLFTMEKNLIIKDTDMVDFFMPMEVFMKVNGIKEESLVWELYIILLEVQPIWVNGKIFFIFRKDDKFNGKGTVYNEYPMQLDGKFEFTNFD